jgi:hypothetical protein
LEATGVEWFNDYYGIVFDCTNEELIIAAKAIAESRKNRERHHEETNQ